MRSNYDTRDGYKIVMTGDSSVGKTCIANRLQGERFDANCSPTVSPGLCKTSVVIDGSKIDVNIWDTAGQERFNCMVPIYARNSCGVILVFDLSNKSSFDSIERWYKQIFSVVDTECKFILCGNKVDLNCSEEDIKATEWAVENNMEYVRVSAKTGENIELLLEKLVKRIVGEGPEVYKRSPNVSDIIYGSQADDSHPRKGCRC